MTRIGGVSPAIPNWIPVCAGMTFESRQGEQYEGVKSEKGGKGVKVRKENRSFDFAQDDALRQFHEAWPAKGVSQMG